MPPRSRSRGRSMSIATSRSRSRSYPLTPRRTSSFGSVHDALSIAGDVYRGNYASAAYKAGSAALKRYRSKSAPSVSSKRVKFNKSGAVSNGVYRGRFKKTRRNKISMEKRLADFSKKGFHGSKLSKWVEVITLLG